MCLASLTQATSPQSEPEVSKAQVQTIEAQIQANEDQSRAIIEAQAQAIEALIQATEAQIQAIEAQSRTSQAIEAQTQTSKRRRTRGPTLCKDLYWLEPGKRLKVILNEYSQPVGKSAIKLTQFLGTIARNGHNFPIDIPEWRNMPASKKEEAWKVVLGKFDVPEEGKDWTMKNLNRKWKDWKHELKKKFYKPEVSQIECYDTMRVSSDQWRNLVAYWSSEAYLKCSAANVKNSSKAKTKHCSGSKSFARVAHEEQERTGAPVDRADVWVKTHTRKDGKPVDDTSATVMKKINEIKSKQSKQKNPNQSFAARNDILAQVMGEDRHDQIRGLGMGPTPVNAWGPSPNRPTTCSQLKSMNEALTRMLDEVQQRMNKMQEDMRQMKECLVSQQQGSEETSSVMLLPSSERS